MDWIQIPLFVFEACGMWMIARKEDWKKWGYVVGLCGEPFWIYTSLENKQYGILALAIFYLYVWCMGIYNYFNLKDIKK